MTSVNRYDEIGYMELSDNGLYVEYQEYAKLQAGRDKLLKENKRLRVAADVIMQNVPESEVNDD